MLPTQAKTSLDCLPWCQSIILYKENKQQYKSKWSGHRRKESMRAFKSYHQSFDRQHWKSIMGSDQVQTLRKLKFSKRTSTGIGKIVRYRWHVWQRFGIANFLLIIMPNRLAFFIYVLNSDNDGNNNWKCQQSSVASFFQITFKY